MRKIAFGLFVVCAVAGVYSLTGCKKDGSVNRKLTGKWTFTEIDDVGVVNGLGYPYTQYFDGTSFLQFNADGTFSSVIDLSYNGTWQASDNTLVLTNQGDSIPSFTFDIKTLSSRDLVLFTSIPNDSGLVQSTWRLTK